VTLPEGALREGVPPEGGEARDDQGGTAVSPDQSTFLDFVWTRRVIRSFKPTPVPLKHIELILQSARWAPNGGRRHLNEYIVLQDPNTIRKVRAVSPGMRPHPPAIIVICLDTAKSLALGFRYWEQASAYVDLGTAMENMLLTAHVLGLGSCPMMSFHRPAVQLLLDLPEELVPEVMVMFGEPVERREIQPRLIDVHEFAHWGRYHSTDG
jgi:nitroreductase